MIFGFNTDVDGSGATYHVQTEDRGQKNPVVDSVVYVGGKIVERVRTPYDPASASLGEIEALTRNQHRTLVELIREGRFVPSMVPEVLTSMPAGYSIRLLHSEGVPEDGRLRFEFFVWNGAKTAPAENASFDVRWMPMDGDLRSIALKTGSDGKVEVFLPLSEEDDEVLMVVCASGSAGREFSKYRVRRDGSVAGR
jgi:hypothetical protein